MLRSFEGLNILQYKSMIDYFVLACTSFVVLSIIITAIVTPDFSEHPEDDSDKDFFRN